jgi:Regulator of ribonuclease activity B
MLDSLAELKLPWFWIFFGLLVILGAWSARKRGDARSDIVAMQQLVASGVDLEVPRETQFAIFVRTEASAEFIRARLANDGYVVKVEIAEVEVVDSRSKKPEKQSGNLIRSSKVVVIYGDTLRVIRRSLTELAAKENGIYLGWEVLDKSPTGKPQQ